MAWCSPCAHALVSILLLQVSLLPAAFFINYIGLFGTGAILIPQAEIAT
jgi:hypothetical protein